MLQKNDKIHKRSIKKIDAMVTGMLLWGIVASIYGIKKNTEHMDERKKEESKLKKILKLLVFWYKEPVIEKKKGVFSRLFKK